MVITKKNLAIAACFFALSGGQALANNYGGSDYYSNKKTFTESTSARLKRQMGTKWNSMKRTNTLSNDSVRSKKIDNDALWVYMATVHPMIADESEGAQAYPMYLD